MPYKLLILAGLVERAHAQQSLSDVANFVGSGLMAGFNTMQSGAWNYVGITRFLLERSWLIVPIFGVLLVVRSGLKLIYGQDEERFEEAKRAIANGLMAMVLTYLTARIVDAFVGATENPGNVLAGAGVFHEELIGIVRWVATLVAVLAIGMIIAAVFTGILSMGSEEALPRIRRAVFGAGAGILIIIFTGVFLATFDLAYVEPADELNSPNPYAAIIGVLNVVTAILLFMALIAVIIVIYAGIMMILSLGDEEQFKKQRSLIIRALIGLFVILVSFIIVSFVVQAFSA